MKLNVKWIWTISALFYVALVLIGYAIYDRFYPQQDTPSEQMQNHWDFAQKRSLFLTILWKNPPFKRFFIKNSLLFVPFCRFL